MDLPFLKKHKEATTDRQYLFAIEISPGVVKSAVWSIVNEKTQVLSVGHPINWDDKSAESLIAAVDQTLSDATTHLDPSGKIAPDQAILGLSATWVHEEKIVPQKLTLLKEMSTKLDLKLVGFVVTPEAVVKYLHHSENVPPTAILLGFWPYHLELTLVKLGKILGIQLVNRSAQVADDVVEGLSRFANVDMLPSRMLLYDSGLDLEEIKQLLLAHPWQSPSKKLPFLHFPKIEILPSDYTVRSISLAGGTEVAKAIGLLATEESEAAPAVVAGLPVQSIEDLGFMENIDAAAIPAPVVAPSRKIEVEPELEPDTPILTAEPQPTYPSAPAGIKPKFRFALPKFTRPNIGSLPSLPGIRASQAKLIGVIVVLVALLGGLGSAYWFLPKATVELLVQPKVLEHSFELTANTASDQVNTEEAVVPARQVEVNVSGEQSAPATGSKTVGDKASGSVLILNSTDSPRKLVAGTTLSSPSGLKFVLDEEVTVASGSGSVFNPQPGKATVKATAALIGTDYNLSAGTEFRVGSFAATQIAAKNEQAISGGTSRQAKAVSKDDISKLRSAVTTSLKDQARQQLISQISDDQTLIAESITLETVSEDLSSKVDEEADSVTLKSQVKATGLVVAKQDLNQLVDEQVRPLIPEGFTAVEQQSQTFTVKDAEEDSVVFTVRISSQLLPNIDTQEVINKVVGKSPEKVRDYLMTLPSVTQVDLAISPKLPGFLTSFPHVAKNISVVIQPAE